MINITFVLINNNLYVWIIIAILLSIILVVLGHVDRRIKNKETKIDEKIEEINDDSQVNFLSNVEVVEVESKIDTTIEQKEINKEEIFVNKEVNEEKKPLELIKYNIDTLKVVPLKGAVLEIIKSGEKHFLFQFKDSKEEVFCQSILFSSKIKCLKLVDEIDKYINKGEFTIKASPYKYQFVLNNELDKEILHSIFYRSKKTCETKVLELVKYIKHIEIKDLT